jgi:hypothetical protein
MLKILYNKKGGKKGLFLASHRWALLGVVAGKRVQIENADVMARKILPARRSAHVDDRRRAPEKMRSPFLLMVIITRLLMCFSLRNGSDVLKKGSKWPEEERKRRRKKQRRTPFKS